MTITKDPDANLDYKFDWSQWLVESDVIASYDIITTGTLVTGPVALLAGATTVSVFLTGGRTGHNEMVTCRITTVAGRIDDRSITLNIKER